MKSKLIPLILAVILSFSCAVPLSGCGGDNDFPVQVANFVVEEEPENIVILDPSVADIVYYIGYEVKMVGRSDEVNQEDLSIVPSVGSASYPNVDDIINNNVQVVFADETLNSEAQKTLEENGILVVKMSRAETEKQLETKYVSIGKILGGKVTGSNKGANAYKSLINDMEAIKASATASNEMVYTACYLYTDEEGLKMLRGNTYGNMLLKNSGATNVAALSTKDEPVEPDQLKVANPNFIFYDSEDTLDTVKKNTKLSTLTAVTSGNTLCIPRESFDRQGYSALDTLQKMVDFMFPKDQPAMNNSGETETTAPQAEVSVADDYGIKLEGLSLKKKDQNDNVKAMQQRLFDLGYVTKTEYITGYYGDITENAVKEFQKKSGIEETGKADNKTLTAMFAENAPKH